jgi:hypothetical protein
MKLLYDYGIWSENPEVQGSNPAVENAKSGHKYNPLLVGTYEHTVYRIGEYLQVKTDKMEASSTNSVLWA